MNAYGKFSRRKHTRFVQSMTAVLGGLSLLGTVSIYAADVSEYGVLKGKGYIQIDASTPSEDFTYYRWSSYVQMSAVDRVTSATVQPPDFPGEVPLFSAGDPTRLLFEIFGGETIAMMNSIVSNGDQLVTMNTENDGSRSVTLELTGDAYPNTPTFLDFAALEAVDSSTDFTLSWSAFSIGTTSDFILVSVLDSDSNEVFSSPAFGEPGALNGASSSVILPAGTLSPESDYMVTLSFTKVADLDTSTYPGAIGLAGYYKSTQASLETTSGSSGGEDTTPPELVSSNPVVGQFGVDVDSSVTFVFNEAMANTRSIAWSENVNSADFTYSWSVDGRTLTCVYADSFPETTLITWQLNPSGQTLEFMDEAGNPLPEDTYSGNFFTANNPCGMEDDSRGSGGIIKELAYTQNSMDVPAPDPDGPASFLGMTTSPTNDPVTSAILQVPGGPLLTLTNFTGFGRLFMASESYSSQSALDAARPSGSYNLRLARASGATPSLDISLNEAYPPTPHVQNYTACQTVDPDADFTVRWNGFSGASEGDFVSISIMRSDTIWYWSAPDPCVPRELPNTSTSVTIPAGTFEPGVTYEASLLYSRLTHAVSNAVPEIDTVGYLHKRVRFTIVTTGVSADLGRFIGWAYLPNGNLELQLEGTVGRIYGIESSDDLLGDWSTVTMGLVPADGVFVFEVPTDAPQSFFRADPQ